VERSSFTLDRRNLSWKAVELYARPPLSLVERSSFTLDRRGLGA
jgi:hypothetical protein